mmetsp:Transcript_36793/g.78434  ORF Transcript_36793/g.78434 Transcript_36793/m.78434 type:complete len:287 (+) Transcript_36793:203-1063(+)
MTFSLLLLEIANPGKLISKETSTTYQTTVNITHGHQPIDTFRGDAASVLDPGALCHLIIIHFCQNCPDEFVHIVGRIGFAYQSRSNGPHGLVRNYHILHRLLAHPGQILADLHGTHLLCDPQIVLLLSLPNTENGLHTELQHLLYLGIDVGVGIAEETPAFGVSAQDVLAAHALHHGGRDASREGALVLIIHLLRADCDAHLVHDVLHLGDEREGREEDHLGAALHVVHGARVLQFGEEGGEPVGQVESVGLRGGVHLPVACHDGLTFVQLGDSSRTIVANGGEGA